LIKIILLQLEEESESGESVKNTTSQLDNPFYFLPEKKYKQSIKINLIEIEEIKQVIIKIIYF